MLPLLEATSIYELQGVGPVTQLVVCISMPRVSSSAWKHSRPASSSFSPLHTPPIQVDITNTQWTISEQVSFTWFLCCACHHCCESSTFFCTCRAAELHIFTVQGVKLLVRASSRFLHCTVTPSSRRIVKLDLLEHQDIGQHVLCSELKRRLLLPDIFI